MMPKPNPRILIAVITILILGVLTCFGTVGFGLGLFYTQRQMTDIIRSAQAQDQLRKLEIDKAKSDTAMEWQKKVDEESVDDAQQRRDIQDLKEQNNLLLKSLDRLSRLSEQRVLAAVQIQNKLDTVASKVDQVSDATPGVKKPTGEINKRIQDTNRSLK